MLNDGVYFTKAFSKLKASYSVHLIPLLSHLLIALSCTGQICKTCQHRQLWSSAHPFYFYFIFLYAQAIWGLFCLIPFPDESKMLQHLLCLDLLWELHFYLFEPLVTRPESKPGSS